MNANRQAVTVAHRLTAASIAFLFSILILNAQVKTGTQTLDGPATKVVTVERGKVVYVSGNDLIVQMENGTVRYFPDVPESARVDVEGRQLGIHDLKPGMMLQRTITTTTTPRTITTVKSVTGTVWQVSPPSLVILTLEDGVNESFKIPKGQKFMVEGRETDAWGLSKGMKVSVTKIVTVPDTVTDQQKRVTGSMPPPPPPPPDVPILIAEEKAPTPAAAEPAPQRLPKTGSLLPLVGLLGLLLSGAAFGIRLLRRS